MDQHLSHVPNPLLNRRLLSHLDTLSGLSTIVVLNQDGVLTSYLLCGRILDLWV